MDYWYIRIHIETKYTQPRPWAGLIGCGITLDSRVKFKPFSEICYGQGKNYGPEFKAARYSTGIRNAVEALDLMARGKPLPRRPISFGAILPWLLFFGLAAFTVVSLIRRGSGGWAWFMWAAGFALVGTLLYHLSRSRSSGAFGGGSFGGGFSGGGGASGSW